LGGRLKRAGGEFPGGCRIRRKGETERKGDGRKEAEAEEGKAGKKINRDRKGGFRVQGARSGGALKPPKDGEGFHMAHQVFFQTPSPWGATHSKHWENETGEEGEKRFKKQTKENGEI